MTNGAGILVRLPAETGCKEGEDFFGKSVILAARISSSALGEQILVSSLLKALVESSGEFGFVFIQLIALLLLALWPELATWLPARIYGS